jgi:hypothetical protein
MRNPRPCGRGFFVAWAAKPGLHRTCAIRVLQITSRIASIGRVQSVSARRSGGTLDCLDRVGKPRAANQQRQGQQRCSRSSGRLVPSPLPDIPMRTSVCIHPRSLLIELGEEPERWEAAILFEDAWFVRHAVSLPPNCRLVGTTAFLHVLVQLGLTDSVREALERIRGRPGIK